MVNVAPPRHHRHMGPHALVTHLVDLRRAPGIRAQVEYEDDLATHAVELCARPGDWERVAAVLHVAVTQLAALQREDVNA